MDGSKGSRDERGDDDRVHVQRCLRGGPEHFAPLVRKYQSRIANMIFRMVKNRDVAAELTQDVFLLAYKNLARFDKRYRFLPWLGRIAHNHSLNAINKRRIRALSLDEGVGEDGATVQDLIEDWSRNPENRALESERKHWVAEGLAILPERYRILMIHRYWLAMSYREISYVTGLEASRVKYLLNYGRRLLHDILNRLRDGRKN